MLPTRLDLAAPTDAASRATELSDAAAPAAAEGEYHGQKVAQLPDPLSEIEDSAEEVGFMASEKIEKSLSERKAHGGEGSERTKAMAALVELYVNMVPDIGSARQLREFLDNLKQNPGDTSPEGLQRRARQFFEDPSHQFAAMEFAQKALEGEGGNGELAGALQTACQTMLAGPLGERVRAGLNVSAQAVEHAERGLGTGGAQELRDFYRDAVLGFEDVSKAYESILKNYGPEKFPQALDFLLQAAGNDLHSGGSSLAPERLRTVVDDLFQVQVLGNSQRAFSDLLRKTGLTGPAADGRALMGDVLGLASGRYPRPEQITALATKVGLCQPEPTIYFLTGLKEQVRLLPLKIYAAPENREALLEAAQGALDKAIQREEEEGA